MQNDQPNKFDPGPQNWLWSDCKLVLKRTNPKNLSQQSYESLQAEVELQSDQIKEPFIPLLQFKEKFFHNKAQGFFWKKGLSLPSLIIKLQKSYFQLLKQDEQLIMIYCQLTIAYPKRKQTHYYLEQIRATGQKRKIFSPEGQVEFNDIVLKQCSHQKSNSKFSVVITICASSMQQNKIILKTLISTAFYTQNSRINRKKINKKKFTMKLISPTSFLKPIKQLNQNIMEIQQKQKQQQQKQKMLNRQKLIESLKNCSNYAKQLTGKHPFYIFYHFSDIFKVYFNSKQIKNLNQLLQKITPQIYNHQTNPQQKYIKNTYISYSVKKTKKIKKSIQNQTKCDSNFIIEQNQIEKNNKNVKISQIEPKKSKKKLSISAILKQGLKYQTQLLIVTFQNNILDIIQNQMKQQDSQIQIKLKQFKQQLEFQISKISKMFSKWTGICMKIDLLKNTQWSVTWKSIQKQSIYQAYKNHYHIAYDKLLGKKVNTNIINSSIKQQIF